MRKESEAPIKAGQPALIVTYGNTTRKYRPLDRDILVLGRAPACDIGLVSPEVAPVHCLILRTADGWHIRDCSGGRYATRLNGKSIHEETLRDTDVLQIGTFSFEVRLPSSRATPAVGSTPVVDERLAVRVKRLQRSRRNLVRLAAKLRQRARRNAPTPSLAELERQAEHLRSLQRDYETLVKEYELRLNEMEQAEREVCDERAAFERECNERRMRLEQTEHEAARQLREAESSMKARWEECQARCRQTEEAHTRFLQALPASANDVAAPLAHEWAVLLDRRSQELNHFARYLRRCRQQLREQMPLPSQPNESTSTDESAAWQEQCQALQAKLAALDARLQQRETEMTAQREAARREADNLAGTVTELQVISESLRREIHDRDVVVEKLRRQLEHQSAQVNLEHSGSYERELNTFRLELERDRQDMNEEICQLQIRQAEMEAAAREAELQMSRERAVIARERAELTRLRDEIRITKDRKGREGHVQDRLANLQQIRQELTGSNSASAPGEQRRSRVAPQSK